MCLALTTAATPLSAAETVLQVDAGYAQTGNEGHPQYEGTAGIRPLDSLGVSAIVVESVTDRKTPELAIGTARIGSQRLSLDVGRPGISLGLTPPVYAGRRPSANRPSVDSTFARTALAAYGVPDYGAGLVGSTSGEVSYSLHAYTLQKQTLSVVVFLALQSGVLDTAVPGRPEATPGCTYCDLAAGLGNAGVDISIVTQLARQFGFIPPDAGPDTRVEFGKYGYHAGVYYAGPAYRYAVDVTAFDAFGGTYLLTPAVEVSWPLWDTGVQAFLLATDSGFGTAGAHAWASHDLADQTTVYLRAGLFGGNIRAAELAFGALYKLKRMNIKFGLEYLNIGANSGGGYSFYPMTAVGVSF